MQVIRKNLILFFSIFLIVFCLISINRHNVQAAVRNVRNIEFNDKAKTIIKKATRVKKGVNVLTVSSGWVYFKAPKKGNYYLTFQDLRTIGKDPLVDYNNGYVMMKELKTKGKIKYLANPKTYLKNLDTGKKCEMFFINTQKSYERYNDLNVEEKFRNTPIKNYRIKLKKGQIMYFYMHFVESPVNLTMIIN